MPSRNRGKGALYPEHCGGGQQTVSVSGTAHRAWLLQLLECAKNTSSISKSYGIVALTGQPVVHRAKPACEEELLPGIPRVLQGGVRRVLQGEGIGWNNDAAILHIQGYLRLSLYNLDYKLKIKGSQSIPVHGEIPLHASALDQYVIKTVPPQRHHLCQKRGEGRAMESCAMLHQWLK